MDQIEIEKGERVDVEIVWEDEAGPVKFTGMELSISEAHTASLVGGLPHQFSIFVHHSDPLSISKNSSGVRQLYPCVNLGKHHLSELLDI